MMNKLFIGATISAYGLWMFKGGEIKGRRDAYMDVTNKMLDELFSEGQYSSEEYLKLKIELMGK